MHLQHTTTQHNIKQHNKQAYDTDSFNRWDAGNRLGTALILKLADMPSVADIEATTLPSHYVDAIRSVLTSCKVRYAVPYYSFLHLIFCLVDDCHFLYQSASVCMCVYLYVCVCAFLSLCVCVCICMCLF